LSISQLRDIFSGKTIRWQQLGVMGGKIHVYARDNDSGTYDTFKSLVLAKKAKLSNSAKRYESNAQLSDDVSGDPDGIGFVGLPYIRESRAVAIKIGSSKARMPTYFNVATEDYALSRRLYMYLSEHSTNNYARQFIQMVGSRGGQKIVEKIGFISQNIRALDYKVSELYPIEYQALNKSALRLSLNFRFQNDSLDMDSRAERDLMRLVAYLQKNKKIKKLMLFGFSEDKAIPIHNIALSEARADKIAYELKKKKVYVHVSRGYGAYDNVASNTEISKNRRVEVWIE
jgi:phosphate transport system substrate-binding protein